MTTAATTIPVHERTPGDQALLLVLAGAQRRLAQRKGRRRPHLRRVLGDVLDELPPSVRPAVRPVLAVHADDIERVLRHDPDASPLELLRRLRGQTPA